ncbi:dihydromethanopterin reductase (acceptor) [archaeon]|nr:dihydromethanopterin reductase (acceptor) [archaeon]
MNIAWGITGAGHLLKDTFAVMEELKKEHRITVFLSGGGEEVLKAYGLWGRLNEICPGDYLEEIITSLSEGKSAPTTGRFFLKKYDMLIVSPATTNTVAKIVCGISDTLVTNAVSHAMKSMIPVYIVPVDQKEEEKETVLPNYVDRDICENCAKCPPQKICDTVAFGDRKIDLLKCTACGDCVFVCEHGAVISGKVVKLKVRKVDAENVEKLRKMEFITVLESPEKIKNTV